MCSQAIQVFGGYGYTRDFPVEQLYRDARIAPIYEGTNGIQAMDLLGRKLGMKKGAVFMNLLAEMNEIIARAGWILCWQAVPRLWISRRTLFKPSYRKERRVTFKLRE